MKILAPVVLFTYCRHDILKRTVSQLLECDLASESELYIFSDGPKDYYDKDSVVKVREFTRGIKGFKNIIIKESTKNNGLASSIINGVSEVINRYGKVIVLEDDLLVSKNFLFFMNSALDFYETNSSIISISGYNMGLKNLNKINTNNYDVYFTMRAASWGWATWKNRWNLVDWEVSDFDKFKKDKRKIREFNKMGTDMYGMLKKQQMGLNNSWAIRFCYHQFKFGLYTVYPVVSKVRNIGFDIDATNSNKSINRFDCMVDRSLNNDFKFSENVFMDKNIIAKFKEKNSLKLRMLSKLIITLKKLYEK